MAPGFEYTMSSLLCVEDNSSIFDDVDNGGLTVDDDFEISTGRRHHRRSISQDHGFNGGECFAGLLPMQSEECLALMFEREVEHLPCADYLNRLKTGDLDLGARKEAVDWICKVQSYYNFGALSSYLSINYLDRFLSAYDMPKGKAWMVHLLAVACLSLAAKVDETDVPLSLDFQIGESKFLFEAKTIQRMELLVLSTLKWRMQSVTPFSFLDYFLYKVNGDQRPSRSSIHQSIQLILSTVKRIDLLEFRPSEIAAAVALSVTGEIQTVDRGKTISILSDHVLEERLLKCVELIQDLSSVNAAFQSVPQSPIGVLDAACLSYKSDDTPSGSGSGSGSGSCANSTHNSPIKRRKLNNTGGALGPV
ncbi:hypothetical protein Ancab_038315 [Ancistrocladus abbreviatus]